MTNLYFILILGASLYFSRTKLIEIIYNLLLQEKKRRLLKEIDDYCTFFEKIYTNWFSKYYIIKNDSTFLIDFDTKTDIHHTKTLTYFPNNYDILFIKRQYYFNEHYSGCVIMPLKFLKHFNRKKFNIISKDNKVICIPPFVFDKNNYYFNSSIREIIDQKAINNFFCESLTSNEMDELKYLINILKMLYTYCKEHKIN
jgi:hypothetical protein